MNHIRDKLPDIKAKLNSLIGQTQQELTSYGDPSFTGKAHRVREQDNKKTISMSYRRWYLAKHKECDLIAFYFSNL